jgi:mevalonate kinase
MAKVATIKTSAPGSLMLLGEHAVLHGKQALVGAINRRIIIELFQTSDNLVRIDSGLGQYQAPLGTLVDHPKFRFVLQAIQQHIEQIATGFTLKIESEFSADIGFGSSAAVTVATHAALLYWLQGKQPENQVLFEESLKTVHAVQGRGSGADLAASVYGGMVGYSIEPEFQPLEISVPLTAVYCGYKTPTPDVILRVEQLKANDPSKYDQIYDEMDAYAKTAISKLRNHDFPGFGKILNRNQELMDEMGVNTPELREIVCALQDAPDIFGAKISGSGMGDCAIGVGFADLSELDYPVYHLEITPAGCQYHE